MGQGLCRGPGSGPGFGAARVNVGGRVRGPADFSEFGVGHEEGGGEAFVCAGEAEAAFEDEVEEEGVEAVNLAQGAAVFPAPTWSEMARECKINVATDGGGCDNGTWCAPLPPGTATSIGAI